ncbi:MAG: hypothetical protein GKS06_00585 [Acidobacteria bacterium]|nr:hypothetical protein [Acidobacteriota bacterium]
MAELGAFDPEAILAVLEKHGVRYVLIGGLAATLHGSPHLTTDVDITPSTSRQNLAALAAALVDLEARIRVGTSPDGLPFERSAEALERADIWNLVTSHGALDLTFTPSGTQGFDDLRRDALAITVRDLAIKVASLADIIRSKEAANREKDRLVLPTLRRLLDEAEGR